MSTKKKKPVECVVIPFPAGGTPKISAFKAQAAAINEKVQLYIDGIILGLGIDPDQNPEVDLEAMTITYEQKEAENASKS